MKACLIQSTRASQPITIKQSGRRTHRISAIHREIRNNEMSTLEHFHNIETRNRYLLSRRILSSSVSRQWGGVWRNGNVLEYRCKPLGTDCSCRISWTRCPSVRQTKAAQSNFKNFTKRFLDLVGKILNSVRNTVLNSENSTNNRNLSITGTP